MCNLFTLRTNSCCCGVSLRTGTIILLIFNAVFSILYVAEILSSRKKFALAVLIVGIIYVIVELVSLYGAVKRKADLLLPHLILNAISLISMVIFCVVSLILFIVAQSFIEEFIKEFNNQVPDHAQGEDITPAVRATFFFVYAVTMVVVLLAMALQYHFFKVVFSYREQLKCTSLDITKDTHQCAVP